MSKIFLLSVIVALLTIPARAASREKNAAKGLRKVVLGILLFNIFYAVGLGFLYGRL